MSSTASAPKFRLCAPDFEVEGLDTWDSNWRRQLQEPLEERGIKPGNWVLPIFLSEDFVREDVVPLFFCREEFESRWNEFFPSQQVPENVVMMDLRLLVDRMLSDNDFDWSKMAFVSSPEAYLLAEDLGPTR